MINMNYQSNWLRTLYRMLPFANWCLRLNLWECSKVWYSSHFKPHTYTHMHTDSSPIFISWYVLFLQPEHQRAHLVHKSPDAQLVQMCNFRSRKLIAFNVIWYWICKLKFNSNHYLRPVSHSGVSSHQNNQVVLIWRAAAQRIYALSTQLRKIENDKRNTQYYETSEHFI